MLAAHATFIESTAPMQIASQATTAAVRSPPQARLTCWMLQMAFSEAAPQLSIWTASAENASWVSVVMSFSHVVQKAASSSWQELVQKSCIELPALKAAVQ